MSKITVDPAKDRRGPDTELRDLLESLAEIGLLHPLLVLPADGEGHHELLAGYRRLRAACQLGWEEVPARIVTLDGLRAELAGLAENLARRALPPGEELRAIARAKTIYESLHPDAKRGGARVRSSAQSKTESFADHTAKFTGVSSRTIRRKAMVGGRADEKILAALDEGAISFGEAEQLVAAYRSQRDPIAARCLDPALGAEAVKASGRVEQEALLREVKKVVLAAEAALPKVRSVVATMDPAARQLCREYLMQSQEAIAGMLSAIDGPGEGTESSTPR